MAVTSQTPVCRAVEFNPHPVPPARIILLSQIRFIHFLQAGKPRLRVGPSGLPFEDLTSREKGRLLGITMIR